MSTLNTLIENFVEPIIIFIIIGGTIAGVQLEKKYFLVSILFLVIFLVYRRYRKRKILLLYRNKIKSQWGKVHKEKRNFESIKELYSYMEKDSSDKFIIDDITWRDLNMDYVFEKIDHTKSLPGMQYLYNLLRNPIFQPKDLEKRNKVINSLLENKDIAQNIQIPISAFGKERESEKIFSYFENGMDVKTKLLPVYRILSYLFWISLAFLIFNRQLGFTLFIVVIFINGTIYQKSKNNVHSEVEIFKYIGALLNCGRSISKIDTVNMDLGQEELKELLKKTRQINRNVRELDTNVDGNMDLKLFLDYINMLTLRETILFYKTANKLNEYKDEIFQIHKHIGKIDAYISIASYKGSLDYYCEPILIEDDSKFYLEAKGLYHPLLEDPVPYSFKLDNIGALVTGSNASGKSTYLRTIGINVLFAQTLYMVLGERYESNYFKLLTSIGTTDNILHGDSYFMAEAKSLQRVVNTLDMKQPVLCILDEIFRGTNTAERISAASEVLDYMINRNCCVVAATHDLELTTIVDDKFNNYHFQETIEEHDIKFDYLLRNGPATSRNAIAILKYLGYPKEIYEKADKRVEEYMKSNVFI